MQSVARPFLASLFCISCSNVTKIRQPEAPTGCPSAIAPPFTLTFSILKPRSLATAIDCAAKASFASIKSISSMLSPVLSSTFLVDATGPTPMISGSTPPSAPATHVAIGVTPSSFAFSSLITTIAAAPSLIPDAFPAVTSPPSLPEQHFKFARLSAVVPARGPSSFANITVSLFTFTGTGTISSSNLPSAIAFSHFCWLFAENASSSSRVMPYLSHTFSAVIIMW